MKQAENKAQGSQFIAPSSIEIDSYAITVKGTNSETGKPYTSTYPLTKVGSKNRKNIEKYLSPDTFFGKGGIKEALVERHCINAISLETMRLNEKRENAFNLLKSLAD